MQYFEWFATTVTGLEDLAAKEVGEIAGIPVHPDIGKIFFKGTFEHAAVINYSSTLINRVYLLLAREEIETLEDLYRITRRLDYTWIIDPSQTFAVKAERHNKRLPFTSMDAAAWTGRAIIESFKASANIRLKVNLDNPEIEFYCLLRDSEVLLGLDTTGESLHRRYYRVYAHRAGLQPTIASAMIKISGWKRSESLLDPMCGGGTIPIEAAIKLKNISPGLMKRGIRLEKLKFVDLDALKKIKKKIEDSINRDAVADITGSDASPKSIEGAGRNIEAAGVSDTVKLMIRDCLQMDKWLTWEPDHIVTNPPYGIRMNVRDIVGFYRRFIESVLRASPNSKLTIIISKPRTFTSILEEKNYRVTSSREVMYGRLRATIISSER
ncbi:MAG: class I SAM-dependent RNA methyltransferase [Thaumarchaeota archaeon]|jgi:tRNA (guanine6-N2)-methyltransferase|nr:class I SAM-dependent RNA methyltransferase [Candidatus Geocrenenecus arthurdayi]